MGFELATSGPKPDSLSRNHHSLNEQAIQRGGGGGQFFKWQDK